MIKLSFKLTVRFLELNTEQTKIPILFKIKPNLTRQCKMLLIWSKYPTSYVLCLSFHIQISDAHVLYASTHKKIAFATTILLTEILSF